MTHGHLLGGRVRYAQPESGFRSGLEPVLLAASVPAKADDRVLEAGSGAGAGLLSLAARVPDVHATGVELDGSLALLAAANAAANGFAQIDIVTGPVESAEIGHGFDHAMANPPYHPPGGPASPVPERETAKRGPDGLAGAWIERLAAALRHRGTLTLIVSAWMIPACLGAMARSRCPCSVIFPLWPKTGRAAKLVLLRGIRNGAAPMRLSHGLVLHSAGGGFTDVAEAVLRDGAKLEL